MYKAKLGGVSYSLKTSTKMIRFAPLDADVCLLFAAHCSGFTIIKHQHPCFWTIQSSANQYQNGDKHVVWQFVRAGFFG